MADVRYSTPSSWVDAFNPSDFQSKANNAGFLSTATEIDNSSDGHLYAEVSFKCVTSTWAVGVGGHLALYLLPVGDDGTTYPNTTDGTAATDYPGGGYFFGVITFKQATLAHNGSVRGVIPPGKFKLYAVNRTGAALPNSAVNMTCKIRRYSETVA